MRWWTRGVPAKWALPEPDSDRALALHARAEALLAPSLIAAEIGNAAGSASSGVF